MPHSKGSAFSSVLVGADQWQYIPGISVIGTAGDETLVGRGGRDTIRGEGGDDVLRGLAGEDALTAGLGGNSTLYGGEGRDTLFAGDGLDVLYGGPDNDDIYSWRNASGRDTIYGGDNDIGGDSVSYAYWSEGVYVDLRLVPSTSRLSADVLYGIEEVEGSLWNDTIVGNAARNWLDGSGGADRLIGLAGNDSLHGDDGDDVLFGGTGRDYLTGGNGDDVIHGGTGADTMLGDYGSDQFVFNVQTDVGGGSDRIRLFDGSEDRILISGLAAGSAAPEVSIFVRPTGVSMVTVGDPANPLFVIAVEDYYGAITLSNIEFSFLE
jgi:Ca2+-binding RTX toxin-like protein